eukprot:scaffold23795_cov30-Tisochrysis_lutea.AAC.3
MASCIAVDPQNANGDGQNTAAQSLAMSPLNIVLKYLGDIIVSDPTRAGGGVRMALVTAKPLEEGRAVRMGTWFNDAPQSLGACAPHHTFKLILDALLPRLALSKWSSSPGSVVAQLLLRTVSRCIVRLFFVVREFRCVLHRGGEHDVRVRFICSSSHGAASVEKSGWVEKSTIAISRARAERTRSGLSRLAMTMPREEPVRFHPSTSSQPTLAVVRRPSSSSRRPS